MKPRYNWQPLRRAVPLPPSEKLIADHVAAGFTREQALAAMLDEESTTEVWKNDLYQVVKRDLGSGWIHLNIRRVDGGAVLRDWRHFQRIKNELVGYECEAIELYPAESRLSDTSNKYHLFACTDPTFRFPFGDIFGGNRSVSYESGSQPGTRQRPL